jgi:ABC-type transport system involved in multi-copper enzyme maturation permease subunit
MLNLILKDFALNRVNALVYFVLVLLCVVLYTVPGIESMGNVILITVPFFVYFLLFCLISIYLFWGDFQNNGLRYICTFPIDRKTIVLSRFVTTTVLLTVPFLTFFIACLLQVIFGVEVSGKMFFLKLRIMLITFSTASVWVSAALPDYFKYNYIRARNRSMVLPVVLALAIGVGIWIYCRTTGMDIYNLVLSVYPKLISPLGLILITLLALSAFIASFYISKSRFYQRDLFND